MANDVPSWMRHKGKGVRALFSVITIGYHGVYYYV